MSWNLEDDVIGPARALLCLILFVAVFFLGYLVGRLAERERRLDDFREQSAPTAHLNSDAERHRTPINQLSY